MCFFEWDVSYTCSLCSEAFLPLKILYFINQNFYYFAKYLLFIAELNASINFYRWIDYDELKINKNCRYFYYLLVIYVITISNSYEKINYGIRVEIDTLVSFVINSWFEVLYNIHYVMKKYNFCFSFNFYLDYRKWCQ